MPVYNVNSEDPDRTPRSLASDLALHCLPVSLLRVSSLIRLIISAEWESPRERKKTDRRDSRGDESERQGRKRNRNESEETEEIKNIHPLPLPGNHYQRPGGVVYPTLRHIQTPTPSSQAPLWKQNQTHHIYENRLCFIQSIHEL